jgi:hypothetical protein
VDLNGAAQEHDIATSGSLTAYSLAAKKTRSSFDNDFGSDAVVVPAPRKTKSGRKRGFPQLIGVRRRIQQVETAPARTATLLSNRITASPQTLLGRRFPQQRARSTVAL